MGIVVEVTRIPWVLSAFGSNDSPRSAAADLRLADPPIPQHQRLDVRQPFLPGLQVVQVPPDPLQAIISSTPRQDLRGNVAVIRVLWS